MGSTETQAEIIVMGGKTLGLIQGPLWGLFIEFVGRGINEGVYELGHPCARPDGVRTDVLEALKELRPTHLRYPGGCATAYFDWQELVGPKEERPRAKLFRQHAQVQETAFGTHEAWEYANELGAELYYSVNAHTQTPEDAANLVEYLNGAPGTKWADLRCSHGHEKPYGIKYFGLGNEIYGDWQPGQKTAAEYAEWCAEAIRQMKNVDPSIELIVCGCGRFDPAWDRIVLNRLIDSIEMISVHNYCGRPVFRDNMAASEIYEQMFNALDIYIDEAMDKHLERRDRPTLAFDEWNVWYRHRVNRHPVPDIEEIYNFGDALTVATIFHVMLRHTRSIKLSNMSEAVNILGSVVTGPEGLIRQSSWFVQKLYRDCHSGRTVEAVVDSPTFSAKHERYFCGIVDTEKAKDDTVPTLLKFDNIPALDVLATVDDEQKRLSVSVVNKLEDQPLTTRLTFRGVQPGSKAKVHRLTGESAEVSNTFENPNAIGLEFHEEEVGDTYTFPPASLTLLEFQLG